MFSKTVDEAKVPRKASLVDDGTGRLRDRRPTDDHSDGCACAYCRTMCCVLCHQANPKNVKVWKSIQGFGRHIQSAHPQSASFQNGERKLKRVTRAIKAMALKREQIRFERQGLRRIPISRFNDDHLKAVEKWLAAVERDPTHDLLLGAITLADERFTTRESYNSAIRRLTADTEEGLSTGAYVTSERRTHFDPRVAMEVLKLSYALGRGWSFIVHLLLLYGINAFVQELRTEGISPPTKVRQLPEPPELLNHVAKQSKEFDFS